mmetsp:Transcript_1784/g.7771  ORF Transcript_1784/g.7771 Transcript_1784/m.7771 type:complete len:339 (+) Transcript_1784:404-1420(+)
MPSRRCSRMRQAPDYAPRQIAEAVGKAVVERRVPLAIPPVDVGAIFQDHPAHCLSPILSGIVQQRVAFLIFRIYIKTTGTQSALHLLYPAMSHGTEDLPHLGRQARKVSRGVRLLLSKMRLLRHAAHRLMGIPCVRVPRRHRRVLSGRGLCVHRGKHPRRRIRVVLAFCGGARLPLGSERSQEPLDGRLLVRGENQHVPSAAAELLRMAVISCQALHSHWKKRVVTAVERDRVADRLRMSRSVGRRRWRRWLHVGRRVRIWWPAAKPPAVPVAPCVDIPIHGYASRPPVSRGNGDCPHALPPQLLHYPGRSKVQGVSLAALSLCSIAPRMHGAIPGQS